MKPKTCLCGGRTDIRCDEQQCDIAGPGKPGDPNECRVCWLRLKKVRSEERGSEEKNVSSLPTPHSSLLSRSSPCLYLGEVLDKLGCSCPAKWRRVCAIHKVCNIQQCKTCPDYEELN